MIDIEYDALLLPSILLSLKTKYALLLYFYANYI